MKNAVVYDTTVLREMIQKRGLSKAEFCRRVKKETGANETSITTHVDGRYKPSKQEMNVYCKLLGCDSKDIYQIWSKKMTAKGTHVTPVKAKPESNSKVFNYDALVKATADAGFTQNRVYAILKISKNSYSLWKRGQVPSPKTVERLSALLNIKPADLYMDKPEEKQEITQAATQTNENPVVKTAGFKEINTQNIHEIFQILNENILLLAKNMDCMAKLHESKAIELSARLDEVKRQVEMLAPIAKADKPRANAPEKNDSHVVVIKRPKEKDGSKEEPKDLSESARELIRGYSAEDDFDTYRVKINRMVNMISAKTHDTHKQILHKFYEEMNRVYGVVYEQLKKEYFEKYGRRNKNGTTELLYETEIFREIFYGMVGTKLGETLAA